MKNVKEKKIVKLAKMASVLKEQLAVSFYFYSKIYLIYAKINPTILVIHPLTLNDVVDPNIKAFKAEFEPSFGIKETASFFLIASAIFALVA
jgi:hypothetical protein